MLSFTVTTFNRAQTAPKQAMPSSPVTVYASDDESFRTPPPSPAPSACADASYSADTGHSIDHPSPYALPFVYKRPAYQHFEDVSRLYTLDHVLPFKDLTQTPSTRSSVC